MIEYSPSIMCVNLLDFREEIEQLTEMNVDSFHIDIMDGHFVSNFSLNIEVIKAIKKISNVPLDIHLMIENPQEHIDKFLEVGVDNISIHIESVKHPNRLLKYIKNHKTKASIAINPATTIEFLPYISDNIDRILVMTVDPGFAGQKYIPSAIDKIKNIKKFINDNKLDIKIQVDGNISYEVTPQVIGAGADILVLGTSSIFIRKQGLVSDYKKYLQFVESEVLMKKCGNYSH